MGMVKTSSFDDLLFELDKDQNFKEEYRKQAPYYDLLITIIRRRKELGLTQKELANKAGMHQSNISKIESGELDVRLSTLIQLAEAMDTWVDISLIEFYDRDDDKEYQDLFQIPATTSTNPESYGFVQSSAANYQYLVKV